MTQEKKSRQIRFYTLAFFCALLIAAHATAVVITKQYYAEIQAIQQELLLQIQLERRVRDTAGVLAELSAERAAVKKYFRTPDDVIAVIEEIEGFGGVVSAPVEVLQVQVEEENAETREGVFIVNVLSEGPWDAMAHLVSLLDSLPYEASLAQLTLSTSGTDVDTPTPQWSLRGTLRITLRK